MGMCHGSTLAHEEAAIKMTISQPMETMVRSYETRSQYKKDVRKRIHAGWHVASVSERTSRYSALTQNLIKARVTMIRPPKRELVVTYTRPLGTQTSEAIAPHLAVGRRGKVQGIARRLATRR